MANLVEGEGEQIQAHVGKKAERILQDYGFTTDGSVRDQQTAFKSIVEEDVTLASEKVCHMIEELNRGQEKEKHIEFSEAWPLTENRSNSSFLPPCWLGCGEGSVERAVKLLREVSPERIKNQTELDNLIKYLDRNHVCIPWCALRKKLGLRISSNPGEYANDLLVSNRQKHHGMSWSADVSTSLATLTAVRHNSQDRQWLLNHDIPFQFDAEAQKPAA